VLYNDTGKHGMKLLKESSASYGIPPFHKENSRKYVTVV
jgi:hypothetical protein